MTCTKHFNFTTINHSTIQYNCLNQCLLKTIAANNTYFHFLTCLYQKSEVPIDYYRGSLKQVLIMHLPISWSRCTYKAVPKPPACHQPQQQNTPNTTSNCHPQRSAKSVNYLNWKAAPQNGALGPQTLAFHST